MDRITPTGWGKQKGAPVQQLGSLRAVLERMVDGGAVVISTMKEARQVEDILHELGRDRRDFKIIAAAAGTEPLYSMRRETVIGVAPDAYRFVSLAMWKDIHLVLSTRYPTVIWG